MNARAKEDPAAPNAYEAVVSSFPGLCGVLLGFVGAYFVAVTLGTWPKLESTYEAWPLVFSEHFKFSVSVPRRILVSLSCVGAGALLLVSMIKAVSAQMLYCAEQLDNVIDVQHNAMVQKWQSDRDSAVSKAILAFHFAVPTIALSLFFLLDHGLVAAGVYIVFFWYGKYFLSWCKERC
ncbi:MAG TPA: hypothetical protein DEQ25_10430 [Methylophaga sp.]|nr:hypothetical protein [Methylophaga sp.]